MHTKCHKCNFKFTFPFRKLRLIYMEPHIDFINKDPVSGSCVVYREKKIYLCSDCYSDILAIIQKNNTEKCKGDV